MPARGGTALVAVAVLVLDAAAVATSSQKQPRRKKINWAEKCTEPDLVAYAMMTRRTCELMWALNPSWRSNLNWRDTTDVCGCWRLHMYNSNRQQSSAIYTKIGSPGKCALSISGIHGALLGLVKVTTVLMKPAERWRMCNSFIYAPFVKIIRDHTALQNWTKMASYLANACTEVTVLGDSLGGSIAGIIAACAASGELSQLQPAAAPQFSVSEIHTYGAIAEATTPLNAGGACIKGRRWIHASDLLGKLGMVLNLVHPKLETTEVFTGRDGTWKYRDYSCSSKSAIYDGDVGAKTEFLHQVRNDHQMNWMMTHDVMKYYKEIEYRLQRKIPFLFNNPGIVSHLMNSSSQYDYVAALRARVTDGF